MLINGLKRGFILSAWIDEAEERNGSIISGWMA
jgi:hypothetical protein